MTRGIKNAIIEEQRFRLHRAICDLEAKPLTKRRLMEVIATLARVSGELRYVISESYVDK